MWHCVETLLGSSHQLTLYCECGLTRCIGAGGGLTRRTKEGDKQDRPTSVSVGEYCVVEMLGTYGHRPFRVRANLPIGANTILLATLTNTVLVSPGLAICFLFWSLPSSVFALLALKVAHESETLALTVSQRVGSPPLLVPGPFDLLLPRLSLCIFFCCFCFNRSCSFSAGSGSSTKYDPSTISVMGTEQLPALLMALVVWVFVGRGKMWPCLSAD